LPKAYPKKRGGARAIKPALPQRTPNQIALNRL
jgi:hypothetical protein